MNWSHDPPTQPGRYWFYGYRSEFCKKQGTLALSIVTVRGKFAHCDGEFVWPEQMEGQWLPLPDPPLPTP